MLRSFGGGGSQARGSLCFGRASPRRFSRQGAMGLRAAGVQWRLPRPGSSLCLPRLAACESPGSSMESLGVGARHEWFSLAVINCNNL